MAGRVAIVDHRQRAVALGEITDGGEVGDIAVHREDAVGDDQLEARARGVGLLEARFELVHVGIGVAVAARLAQPDAVDDRGVVQRVGDDGVLSVEQRLEDAAVGVEARGEQDCVVLAEMRGDGLLEFAMQGLRAADEAHRRHAEAEVVKRALGRRNDFRMIGETEIIVGAEIDHLALAALPGDANAAALWAGDQPLALAEARCVDLAQNRAQMGEERVGHNCLRLHGTQEFQNAAPVGAVCMGGCIAQSPVQRDHRQPRGRRLRNHVARS